jgi:hypothetical protein
MAQVPFWERIGCSVNEAIAASSIKRTKIYELLADNRLKSTLVDGRRVISVASLRQLIEGESLRAA